MESVPQYANDVVGGEQPVGDARHPTHTVHRLGLMEETTHALGGRGIKIRMVHGLHDTVPTSERLHRIQLAESDCCRRCERLDTLEHRLTDSGEGTAI